MIGAVETPLPLQFAMGSHAEWREQACRGLGGACLKIPSTRREAPPVRRRRFLGGVGVILVPHACVKLGLAGGSGG